MASRGGFQPLASNEDGQGDDIISFNVDDEGFSVELDANASPPSGGRNTTTTPPHTHPLPTMASFDIEDGDARTDAKTREAGACTSYIDGLVDKFHKSSDSSKMVTGLVFIAMSGFIFSIMSLITKISGRHITPFTIVLVSAATRWMCLATILASMRINPIPHPRHRRIILLRCTCGTVGYACAIYSFTAMPLGDATAIVFSAPIWASIAARIFLKEPLGIFDWCAIVVSIGGVMMITRPTFDLSEMVAPMVALLASFGAGGVVVCIRALGMIGGGVNPAVLSHIYALFMMTVSPLGLLLPGQSQTPDGSSDVTTGLVLAGLVGCLATANQLLLNTGMQLVPASLGSMMRNVDIVASFMWQVVIFHEPVEVLSVLGSFLIIGCTGAQALRKWRQQRKADRDGASGGAGGGGTGKGPGGHLRSGPSSLGSSGSAGRNGALSDGASEGSASSPATVYSPLPVADPRIGSGEGDEF